MKTKTKTLNYTLGGAVCAGALLASGASAQNLFVSDYTAQNIYEYTSGGAQSTFASGMNYPFGIAFDPAGNLFVANSANNGGGGSITEITRAGTPSTFSSESDPIVLAFNNSGTLFAADYSDGNIYKYTGGVQSTFAGGFTTPISMAFDSAGDLFVGSGYGDGNGIITKITPGGTQTPFASGLNFPGGMTFNGAGDLLVTEQDSGTIFQYTPGGGQSTFATTLSNSLNGLAFDSSGNLFVGSAGDGSIIEIAPGGAQSTFASGLANPAGLAFQPVPEPSVMALGAIGTVAFFARRHR